MQLNWRDHIKTEEHLRAYIDLDRTEFNDHLISTSWDILTHRNGVRVQVVNYPLVRELYTYIFSKLGYDVSGDKYIIGNSVIKFTNKLDIPRGSFYRYIFEG
ncbi:hypothetical protein [Aeromonas phage AS-yj]|uniref:Uncharacterized protein n=3 Tax=Ceceduovirus TaxID=2842588 RepID=I6XGU9_9CAUD|nr:hypothetical protein F485_gp059 [Aeromonas phage CC2]YP_009834911.1 hypothetical protein HWB29_gp209 [Aeromonas phage AS-sw]AFN39306.1 hypothetical protein CC2_317 [Aeromonas phage CC2]ATI17674.1 hypothetical protein [Aeromonas phage AS-yj]ATI18259.1 hypothetical protein [Aeromonas phage AS-sw]